MGSSGTKQGDGIAQTITHLFVHGMVLLVTMLLEFLPAWFFQLNLVVFLLCTTSRGKTACSLISIAVFYIQTMDFMVSSVNVWPKKVIAAQSYLSSYWNLYFPSLSCDLPSLFPLLVSLCYFFFYRWCACLPWVRTLSSCRLCRGFAQTQGAWNRFTSNAAKPPSSA